MYPLISMLWWLWQDGVSVCSWIFPSGYKYLKLTSFLWAWRPLPREQELRACISKWYFSWPLFLLCHLHRVFSAIVKILLLTEHWEVTVCFLLQDLACGLAACLTLESCSLANGAGLCWFVRLCCSVLVSVLSKGSVTFLTLGSIKHLHIFIMHFPLLCHLELNEP